MHRESARARLPIYEYPTDAERPRTRAECEGGFRPCPFVSCRYHLYLDVTPPGNLRLNFPALEPWELRHSCALDIADEGGSTLAQVGEALQVTRERIRQLEGIALRKLRAALPPALRDADLGRFLRAGFSR